MNHVKTFVTHWYAFDESSYEKNISLALNLIGNKGKELLNEYNDVNMLNSLIQKNIRYGVRIKDVEINTQTIPVSGKIIFTQTGYRAREASHVISKRSSPSMICCPAARKMRTEPR